MLKSSANRTGRGQGAEDWDLKGWYGQWPLEDEEPSCAHLLPGVGTSTLRVGVASGAGGTPRMCTATEGEFWASSDSLDDACPDNGFRALPSRLGVVSILLTER